MGMYHGPILIKHYKVSVGQNLLLVANDRGPVENVRATVSLDGQDNHQIHIYFIDDTKPLPEPFFTDYGRSGGFFLHYTQYPHIVDLLRNEKPIYGHLYAAAGGGGRIWIGTDSEPVGEGEVKR